MIALGLVSKFSAHWFERFDAPTKNESSIKDNFNLREDIVSHDINRESLQKNSDKTEDGFYLVPKVIE